MIGFIKRAIVKSLKRKGYHLHASGYLADNFFELLLYELLKKNQGLYFIQIGANDGVSFDPIHNSAKEMLIYQVNPERHSDYPASF